MPSTLNETAAPLIDRVRKILLEPQAEWPVIEREATDIQQVFVGYVAILAAIPPLFMLLGQVMFGRGVMVSVLGAVLTYILSLASVYVAGFIVDKLAPNFASQPNLLQGIKLVAYASTPTYVAGVVGFIPLLGALVGFVAALYAIYLFYLGLPVLMKTPADKVIPYMLVVAVVMIVLWVLVMMITATLMGLAIVGSI